MLSASIKRRPAVVSGLAAAAVFGVLGFLVPVAGEEPVAELRAASPDISYAFPVRTARARRQCLVHWVEAGGHIRPARNLEIVSRIRGAVDSVRVSEGALVRRGDTLLTIEDGEYRLALERARVGLLGSQIEYRTLVQTRFLAAGDSLRPHEQMRRAGERLKEIALLRGRAGSNELDLVREERELTAALAYATLCREDVLAHRSGLAMAQEMAERARRDLEATVIRAPFAGEVADCPLTAHGEVVPGQRLLTLLDLSSTVVEAGVLEHDIARVRPGQPARIVLVSLESEAFSGTVVAVNPLIDPASGTYRATVIARPPGSLHVRPGMLAGVRIATAYEPEMVVIPQEALLHREGRTVVFVVRNGRAEWRYVTPGPANGTESGILLGINAGEEVITQGHLVLAHDARVSVLREGGER